MNNNLEKISNLLVLNSLSSVYYIYLYDEDQYPEDRVTAIEDLFCIVFKFSEQYIYILYDVEFDELNITVSKALSKDAIRRNLKKTKFGNLDFYILNDMSQEEPWQDYVGCQVNWVWMLINSQGYTDGYQFVFDNFTKYIQVLTINGIKIHTFWPLESVDWSVSIRNKVWESIIKGHIKHLEQESKNFKRQIEDAKKLLGS